MNDITRPAQLDRNSRSSRLREALRENLKRRKAQARGRTDAESETAGRADAADPDQFSGDDT